GCQINLALQEVDMSAPDNDTFRLHAIFDVDTVVDIRGTIFGGEIGSCDMRVNLNDGDITADIGFLIDSATGELGIELQGLDVDLSGFDAEDCGLIDNIADFVVDVISSPLGNFLINLLIPVIDDLIQGFLPDPLGVEGMIDDGALL